MPNCTAEKINYECSHAEKKKTKKTKDKFTIIKLKTDESVMTEFTNVCKSQHFRLKETAILSPKLSIII